jgi:hypothetical protein
MLCMDPGAVVESSVHWILRRSHPDRNLDYTMQAGLGTHHLPVPFHAQRDLKDVFGL